MGVRSKRRLQAEDRPPKAKHQRESKHLRASSCSQEAAADASAHTESGLRRSQRTRRLPPTGECAKTVSGSYQVRCQQNQSDGRQPSGHVFERDSLIGQSVKKDFPPHGEFCGVVVSWRYSQSENAVVYMVHYEDGDSEELTLVELSPVVDVQDTGEKRTWANSNESDANQLHACNPPGDQRFEENNNEGEEEDELQIGSYSQLVSYSQTTCSQDHNAIVAFEPDSRCSSIVEEEGQEQDDCDSNSAEADDTARFSTSSMHAETRRSPTEGVVASFSDSNASSVGAVTAAADGEAGADDVLPTPATGQWGRDLSPQGFLTEGRLPSNAGVDNRSDADYGEALAPQNQWPTVQLFECEAAQLGEIQLANTSRQELRKLAKQLRLDTRQSDSSLRSALSQLQPALLNRTCGKAASACPPEPPSDLSIAKALQQPAAQLQLDPAPQWGAGMPLTVPVGVEAVIGRQQPRVLGISDVHVSRSHARLLLTREGRVTIEALGRYNCLRVVRNWTKLRRTSPLEVLQPMHGDSVLLSAGDLLCFGVPLSLALTTVPTPENTPHAYVVKISAINSTNAATTKVSGSMAPPPPPDQLTLARKTVQMTTSGSHPMVMKTVNAQSDP